MTRPPSCWPATRSAASRPPLRAAMAGQREPAGLADSAAIVHRRAPTWRNRPLGTRTPASRARRAAPAFRAVAETLPPGRGQVPSHGSPVLPGSGPAVRRRGNYDVRPAQPGLQPLGILLPAGHVESVCEAREGAGPYQPPGNRTGGGKAEKPDGQEAEWRPLGPDPGNAGEGRSPRRPFLVMCCAPMRRRQKP